MSWDDDLRFPRKDDDPRPCCCKQTMTVVDRVIATTHDDRGRLVRVKSRVWKCEKCGTRRAIPTEHEVLSCAD
jgi:hypothetical protein